MQVAALRGMLHGHPHLTAHSVNAQEDGSVGFLGRFKLAAEDLDHRVVGLG